MGMRAPRARGRAQRGRLERRGRAAWTRCPTGVAAGQSPLRAFGLEDAREPVPAVDLAAVLAAERGLDLLAGERAGDLRLLGAAVDLRADRVGRERCERVRIPAERLARLRRLRVRSAVGVARQLRLLRRPRLSLRPEGDRQDGRRRIGLGPARGRRVVRALGAATGEERRDQRPEKEEASSSVSRAMSTSRSVIARLTCVHQRTVTAFQLIAMSGWWSAASAASASRSTNAIASAKSLKRKPRWSAPRTSFQPSGYPLTGGHSQRPSGCRLSPAYRSPPPRGARWGDPSS